MTGFKSKASGVPSNPYTNWATTTVVLDVRWIEPKRNYLKQNFLLRFSSIETVQRTIHVHCDQIARLFSDTWPFISMEICLMAYKICPRRPKMLPNKQEIISQNCPRLGIFCQSSEISPNLVTLIPFTSICLLLFSQLMLIWLHLPT